MDGAVRLFCWLREASRRGNGVGRMISVDGVLSEARVTFSLANSLVWEAEKISRGLKRRGKGQVPFTDAADISDFAHVLTKMSQRHLSLTRMESRLLSAMHLIARDTSADEADPLQLNMIMSRLRTGDTPESWRRVKKAPRAHFELSVEGSTDARQGGASAHEKGMTGLNFETGEDLKMALEIVEGFRALQAARNALLMAERKIKEQVRDLVASDETQSQKKVASS